MGLLYYLSGLGFLNHESQRRTLLSLGTEKPICLNKVKRNMLKGRDKNYLYRKKKPSVFNDKTLCKNNI